jgi:hypothetical protein
MRRRVAGYRSLVNKLQHIWLGTHSLSERQENLHCSRRVGIHYRFFDNSWRKFRPPAEKLDPLNCLKPSGSCKNRRRAFKLVVQSRECSSAFWLDCGTSAVHYVTHRAVVESQSTLPAHDTISETLGCQTTNIYIGVSCHTQHTAHRTQHTLEMGAISHLNR